MAKKQKVMEIECTILGYKSNKGPMAYFKNFTFEDLVDWVWRTCQGCDQINIIPNVKIDAIFEDRVETYTLIETEIPSNVPLER